MGYEAYLWRMLQPMGVYSQGGYQGGELSALGSALDQAEAYLTKILEETKIESAQSEGLSMAEELFPILTAETVEERREKLRVLWQTDNCCFSKEAIVNTLDACGVHVTIGNTGTLFQILVVFSEPLTIWDEPVFQFWLLEQVLPCHLVVTVRLTYTNVETGQDVVERSTLEVLRQRTQSQWEALLGAYI